MCVDGYFHKSGNAISNQQKLYWKLRVVMMPTLLSLAAPQVVVTTTWAAASDGKFGIMTNRLSMNSH